MALLRCAARVESVIECEICGKYTDLNLRGCKVSASPSERLVCLIWFSVAQRARVISLSLSTGIFLSSVSYCSISIYFQSLLLIVLSTYFNLYFPRGRAPALAIRRLNPLIRFACLKTLSCFPSLPTLALNAQVSEARFLTFFECFLFFVSFLTRRPDHPYANVLIPV